MRCLMCGKKFKPRTSTQKFCSNRGRNNCKDRYNNRNRLKISKSRLRYLGYESEEQYIEDKYVYCYFEDDF